MEHSPLTWRERAQLWLRLGLRGALALGGAALVVWVGVPLASLLSPFLFALVLAWVLNPAVRWLQRRTRLSRKAVSLVLVVLVFAVIGGVLFGLGWMAVDQVRMLFDNRQSLLDELLNGLVGAVNSVGRWLEGLGAEDRALFIRRYWAGEAVKELAGELGQRPNAVTKRLLRLRESLRKSLEREGISV